VIDKCNVIAENENIKQRHKYKKESKQLLRSTYDLIWEKKINNYDKKEE
jgi:hypothetical protein